MRAQLIQLIQMVRSFLRKTFHAENPELPYYITLTIALILFVIAMNGFVYLTEELIEDNLTEYDKAASDFVNDNRTRGLTLFFLYFTHLGGRVAYIVFIVAFAIISYVKKQNWRWALQSALVLLLSQLSNIVLKRVFNRARPTWDHLVSVDSLSYPSGHAMSATAFYGFFIYMVLHSKLSRMWKLTTTALLILLILFIGVSRVYLGVHFASDVLAGFMGGLLWVTFCVIVFNIMDMIRRRKLVTQAKVRT